MKKLLGILLPFVSGAVLMYGIASIGLLDGLKAYPKQFALFFIIMLPISYLFVVGVHELGHVALGRWQQFDFYGLTVGPLSWKPDDNGKIKFHWNKNLNLSGGVAMMLPRGGHDLATRFGWFAAGGPILSIALAILLWGISTLLPSLSFVSFMAKGAALLSAMIFLATILPFKASGFSSDGMRILTFLRGGTAAEADLIGLQSVAAIRAGKGYHKLPIEQIRMLADRQDISLQQRVTMRYYDYLYQLSKDEVTKAAENYQYVLDNLDAYPDGLRTSFYVEQAIFASVYQEDLAGAEAALAKHEKSPFIEKLSLHLAAAGIASLKGDEMALRELIPAIETQLSKSMDQNRVPIIRGWLDKWRREIEN